MRYIVLCSAVLVAAAASAQSVDFGVHGNLVNFQIPSEVKEFVGINPATSTQALALEEVYGLGYGGGIHFDVTFAILSLRVSGDYITLSPDNDKFQSFIKTYLGGAAANVSVDGGQISVISGNANLKLTVLPLPVVQPYITGGIGLGHVKADDVKITFNNVALPAQQLLKEETVMTLNGGAGVDLNFGETSVFAEVKVMAFFLEPKTSTFLPIGTVGITF
jgi:opacity protein-like surface antigen